MADGAGRPGLSAATASGCAETSGWPRLCARSVAVVGARSATAYGEMVATEMAAGLGERGFTVVSGAAFGIDAAAHRGALALGSTTLAVLAGGVDRPYPSAHARLIDRIREVGAVLSEVPPGVGPDAVAVPAAQPDDRHDDPGHRRRRGRA